MVGFLHFMRILQQLEDLCPQGGVAGQTYIQANMLQNCLRETFKIILREEI